MNSDVTHRGDSRSKSNEEAFCEADHLLIAFGMSEIVATLLFDFTRVDFLAGKFGAAETAAMLLSGGIFRSKDTILDIYDALESATRTGVHADARSPKFVYPFKITLLGTKPTIWQRIQGRRAGPTAICITSSSAARDTAFRNGATIAPPLRFRSARPWWTGSTGPSPRRHSPPSRRPPEWQRAVGRRKCPLDGVHDAGARFADDT